MDRGEQELLREIHYLTNLIQSRESRGSTNTTNSTSGTVSSVSTNQYRWDRLSHVNPSACQNSRNVQTVFQRRPSKKTRKRFQKLGLSYHVVEPYHRKKCTKKKASMHHHSNLVYINSSLGDSASTESHVDSVESQIGMSTMGDSHSITMNEASQALPAAKAGVQVLPTEDKTHTQMNAKTSRKKKRRRSKLSKKCLPLRSQLTWRRQVLDDDHAESSSSTVHSTSTTKHRFVGNPPSVFAGPSSTATATKRPQSSASNVYKWRRRSSSGSKPVPISPLVSHTKFKMTRASLLRKYNYIRHSPQTKTRQRLMHFPTVRQHSSPKSHRPVKFQRKSKNKVWLGSGTATMDSGPKTTKSKRLSLTSPFSVVLAGRETKTMQGNRQWVSTRHIQLTQQSLRKAALLSSAKRASLVSLETGSYMLDPSRRKLKKVDSSVTVSPPSNPLKYHVNMEASVKRIRANHVVEKSRRYVWRAKNRSKSRQYCMFFNRFGKCNQGEKCPYIHDPDKIAVCPRYLKGLCEKTDGSCPLSHKISKEKMPVCSFFLRGVCVRENCPYLHVSVGKDADICMDFVKGYCSKGEQCTKKHILDCPEFLCGGECPRGKQCPLRHRKRIMKSVYKGKSTGVDVKQPRAFGNIQHRQSKQPVGGQDHDDNQHATTSYTSQELNFIPLEVDSAPDFIAL